MTGSFALVLHSGDYLAAHQRREGGLADRYRHHRYALSSLDQLRADGVAVTVVTVYSPEVYDERVAPDLRFLSLGGGGPRTREQAEDLLAETLRAVGPTHVMVRFPSVRAVRAATALGARVSVVLADSFPDRWRHLVAYRRLARALREPSVDVVGNHHLAASRQLVGVLGLDPVRVVPWDWPLDLLDLAASASRAHRGTPDIRLFYAGTPSRAKGVLDLLDAVELLAGRGTPITLAVAGSGGGTRANGRVDELVARGLVHRLGRIGGDEILAHMQAADFVVVPSRPKYPEGLPLTIYEAMASGTPLVASDHPMFVDVVREGDTGFVFRAGDPASLAEAITRGWADPAAYEQVSARARAAYPSLGLDTLWGDLLHRWVRGTPEDLAWLRDRSLAGRHGTNRR